MPTPVVNNFVKRYRAASAFFTYVSLEPGGQVSACALKPR